MRFPDAKPVKFGRMPLVEIICQLRFSPVLRIESSAPAGVQEKLRREGFETYEQRQSSPFPFVRGSGAPIELPSPRIEHLFGARDGSTKIVLARDFISVDTSRYKGWTEFFPLLRLAARAAQEEFEIGSIVRVGQRFQNVFVPSELGLEGAPWSELLRPELLGLLSCSGEDDVVSSSQEIELILAEPIRGRVRHGLVEMGGKPAYVIDSDFYSTELMDMDRALQTFEILHDHGGRFFQWCLTERLFKALQPQPKEG